jgi:hypothetical protein
MARPVFRGVATHSPVRITSARNRSAQHGVCRPGRLGSGAPHETERSSIMLKVLGGTVGVIFLIGLIVVIGILMLIF